MKKNLITNEEKAKLLADQCKPCSTEFYKAFYQGVLIGLNAVEGNETKKIVRNFHT